MLEKEFEYYLSNQNKLLETYSGKHIVIKNQKVIGSYESESEAYFKTEKTEELGTFLIQLCEPGEESYTETFHSRVSFSYKQ
jgi:hypothetical protein